MSEPTAPPDDTGEEPDEQQLYPFMDVQAAGDPAVTIRAGWADAETSEPREFVVQYAGSAGSPAAESAYKAALEWYRDTLSALAHTHDQAEPPEREDEED